MKFLPFFICLFLSTMMMAQANLELKGQVTDQTGVGLPSATAILLQAADSTMQGFSTSDEDGNFSFEDIPQGNYILQISFMGYENRSTNLELNKSTDLGQLVLKAVDNKANEVEIVQERIPIQIKDDTVQYDANAFKTKEHDNVEALLKKMPGIDVDRNVNVKAQGETVDKIMVDGKEFFGNDPQLALKNLPAGAVDKVQVFDRKSELADFTGVDDGERSKTINLMLKKGKKGGVLGQVEGGYGLPDHRYRAKVNLNYFNPKMQVSAIGNLNNINEQSFDFMDYINLMGGISALMSGGDGMLNLEIGDDAPLLPLLMDNREGLATNLGAGLNGNFFFNKKSELNIHYLSNMLAKSKLQHSFTSSATGLTNFSSRAVIEDQLSTFNHNLTAKLRNKLTTATHLDFKVNFRWNNSESGKLSQDSTFNRTLVLQNNLGQHYSGFQNGYGIGGSVDFKHRFKKVGRSFVSSFNGGYSDKKMEYTNLSSTRLYNENGTLTMVDSIAQNQYGPGNQYLYGADIRYTEPISKKSFLNLELKGQVSVDDRNKDYYDLVNDVEQFNDSLSNHFRRDYNVQVAAINFQHNAEKTNLTIGLMGQRSFLGGQLNDNSAKLAQSYYYPLGRINFGWKIAKGRDFRLSYRSSIKEPTLQQLQPVVDNSNPLNIVIGNPSLRPEYQHNFNLRYNLFNQFSFIHFFAGGGFSAKQSSIIWKQSLDESLRTISEPLNVGLTYSGRANTSFGAPIRALDIKTSLDLEASLNQSIAYVNNVENKVWGQQLSMDLSIENRKKQLVDWVIGTELIWNKNSYSVNREAAQSFLNQFVYTEITVDIGERMDIGTDFELAIYADKSFAERIYLPMWSAEVNRYFLKGNRLRIGFEAYNLLNIKQIVRRYTAGYSVSEDRFNTLGRYFMLKASFKLNKV